MTDRVQVIDRSVDLLEALADGPRSLSEVCRTTGLSKGTAFRLLAGLGARGIVIKDPAAVNYMLGPGLLRLVQGALSGVGAIATLGRTALESLAAETGETVALHVQTGVQRVCIDEVPSQNVIRYTSSIGSVAPLHIGSAGKVLLAFMEPEAQQRTLALMESTYDDVDAARLAAALKPIARDGLATSTGERVEGASAITVPIRSGVLLLSLSVLGPTPRLPKARLLSFVPVMRQTAAHIEDALPPQVRPRPEVPA